MSSVSTALTDQSGMVSGIPPLNMDKVRRDFPILARQVHGKRLVYLDTAASAQRPLAVIEATDCFYREHNANVHRGVHTLSQEATDLYEAARHGLAKFINAGSDREVIFTRGTTESINLVAQSFLRSRLNPGDEILITHMEHHSNIVPWQMLCEETGAILRVAPINQQGELEMDALEAMLSERVKLLGIVQISNALGTVNPVGGGVSDGCGRFLGGGVVGAQVAGPWPGLDGDSLFDGQDLAITTDIRDVLVQLMQRRPPDEVAAGLFPDFNPGTAPELFLPKT